MGRWSGNPSEVKHVLDIVMKAVDSYGRDVDVALQNGVLKRGRFYSMGIRNTNGQAPVTGEVVLTDANGNSENLDPLDIVSIT